MITNKLLAQTPWMVQQAWYNLPMITVNWWVEDLAWTEFGEVFSSQRVNRRSHLNELWNHDFRGLELAADLRLATSDINIKDFIK